MKIELLLNIDKVHTTKMSEDRIRKKLNIANYDVVKYCNEIINNKNCYNYYRSCK